MNEAYTSLLKYHASRAAHFAYKLEGDANNIEIFNEYTFHLFKVEEMRGKIKKGM